jgi:hypothetical protein
MTKRKKTRRSKRRSSKRRKRGGGPRAIEVGWLKKENNAIAINILFRNRLIEIADKIILTWAGKGFIPQNTTGPQLREITVLLVDKIIAELGGRSRVYDLRTIILSQMWRHTGTISPITTILGNNKRLSQGYLNLARRKFPNRGGGGGGGGGTGFVMPNPPSEAIQVGDVTIFADGTRMELPSVEGLSAAAAAAVAQPLAILANPSGSGGRRRKRRRRKRTRRRRRKSRRKRSTRQY